MKATKWILVMVVCVLLTGCESFTTGFVAGVSASKALADKAQEDFIGAVNALNEETAKINSGIEGIEGAILIKPETLEAVKGLKNRANDPVTWIALASLLGNAIWGGRTIEKKKAGAP